MKTGLMGLLVIMIAFQVSCSSSKRGFDIRTLDKDYESMPPGGDLPPPSVQSDDETYGYTEENPIRVGGNVNRSGPGNERKYLSSLVNEDGAFPKITRQGNCCPFKTPHGMMGNGVLDIYQLVFEKSKDTIILYLDLYDYETPKIPKGLKLRE